MELTPNPCPFCGNTKLKVDSKHNGKWSNTGTHSATVRCSKCHARGPTASCKVSDSRWSADEATKQRAIELWNNLVITQPKTCEGCCNIAFREPCASMYPCVNCVRANQKDYYNVPVE